MHIFVYSWRLRHGHGSNNNRTISNNNTTLLLLLLLALLENKSQSDRAAATQWLWQIFESRYVRGGGGNNRGSNKNTGSALNCSYRWDKRCCYFASSTNALPCSHWEKVALPLLQCRFVPPSSLLRLLWWACHAVASSIQRTTIIITNNETAKTTTNNWFNNVRVLCC